MFINLEVNHYYCIGVILEGWLICELLPIDIEQWRAEIGNFNRYLQHSIAKLYLNLFHLLSYIVLMFICILILTLSLITKLQAFWYFTTGFLYVFTSFVSVSISWSNILKLIFPERPSTNYFYIITFIITITWLHYNS